MKKSVPGIRVNMMVPETGPAHNQRSGKMLFSQRRSLVTIVLGKFIRQGLLTKAKDVGSHRPPY